MDNQVQTECEKDSLLSSIAKENFAFVVGWIELKTSCEVEIGYFGACVNTSFNQKFVKKNGMWEMCN